MKIAAYLLLLLAACADVTTDPPSSRGPGGGAPLFCPNTADAYAMAQVPPLPLPYPANPQNPTPYDPALPPPYHYHACLSASGALTSRQGMPCYVCTESTDYYAQLFPGGGPCTQDTARRPLGPPEPYVVCVPAVRDGAPDICAPSTWGCS